MKFPLGRVLVTDGVQTSVPRARALECLNRHAAGDWGVVEAEDVEKNNAMLHERHMLMSAYPIDESKPSEGHGANTLWIITAADRSHTTLLLPEEY